jgi:hypothetical protein
MKIANLATNCRVIYWWFSMFSLFSSMLALIISSLYHVDFHICDNAVFPCYLIRNGCCHSVWHWFNCWVFQRGQCDSRRSSCEESGLSLHISKLICWLSLILCIALDIFLLIYYWVTVLGVHWSYKGARCYFLGCKVRWHSWAWVPGNFCWESCTCVVCQPGLSLFMSSP